MLVKISPNGDKRIGVVVNDSRAGLSGVCAWFVRADTLHIETIAPVTMESTVQEIRSVEGEIQGVTREIEAVTQELNALNLSDDDKGYFRQKEDRLRQKEDRLRQEKDHLRQKELILLQRSSPAVPTVPEDEALGEQFMSDRKLLEDLHSYIVKRDRATPQITPASHGLHDLSGKAK